MNIRCHPSAQRGSGVFAVLLGFGLVSATIVTLLGCVAIAHLRLSGESRTLRNSIVAASPAAFHRQVELNIHRPTAFLVNLALRGVHLPPDARAALRSVRAAQVGVYRMDRREVDASRLLTRADKVLASRDWERIVTVIQEENVVGVYALKHANSPDHPRFCVVTWERDQLVLVSAEADVKELAAFTRRLVQRIEQTQSNRRLDS